MGDEFNFDFLERMIDSMEEALAGLEDAFKFGDLARVHSLKIFIFDLHRKVNDFLEEADV